MEGRNTGKVSLVSLPAEVLAKILKHLDAKQLINVERTSWSMYNSVQNPELWKNQIVPGTNQQTQSKFQWIREAKVLATMKRTKRPTLVVEKKIQNWGGNCYGFAPRDDPTSTFKVVKTTNGATIKSTAQCNSDNCAPVIKDGNAHVFDTKTYQEKLLKDRQENGDPQSMLCYSTTSYDNPHRNRYHR
eukprot:TRINITY_DN16098_c0_g1_i1.p1 TRINITY_DN16098_c0_g1~~TRINITY_DN16098_c0_g1_i1.p1  ORF type:complete len:188 (-),score=39.98 TRINITY_DN16098_c0_g1_i1:8-571(-)